MFKTSEFKGYSKKDESRTAQMIENPFKNFAASKMSNSVKPMTVVEFTDLFGTKHVIKCSNKTKMKEAMAFLSLLKAETAKVKAICNKYKVNGKIKVSQLPKFRAELKAMGFGTEFITKLASI
jgi:aspartate carbamoyltransferase regulatory subunit